MGVCRCEALASKSLFCYFEPGKVLTGDVRLAGLGLGLCGLGGRRLGGLGLDEVGLSEIGLAKVGSSGSASNRWVFAVCDIVHCALMIGFCRLPMSSLYPDCEASRRVASF